MSANLVIVGFSVVFHLLAALLALRLIKITGAKAAWLLITVAIVIQLVRRMISFWYLLPGAEEQPVLPDELIGMFISFFMFVGVAWIAPMFISIRQSEEKMKSLMLKAEEEKAKTESIIAAIGDGISIQDRDLTVVYQNKIHISFFGDQRGKKCHQAYRQLENPCDACPVITSFKNGEIRSTEMTAPTDNGISYFEITTSPLRDAAGEVIAGIEVVRNIDRRKKMAQEREDLIHNLQEALTNIKTLRGLLPICAACKKIRDDKGYWNQIESYIRDHSEAEFSHSICPDCAKKLYPEYYKGD
jgi:PAS domain-containing protein